MPKTLSWCVYVFSFALIVVLLACAPDFPVMPEDVIDPDDDVPGNCAVTFTDRVVVDGIKCPYSDQATNGLISVQPARIQCFKIRVDC